MSYLKRNGANLYYQTVGTGPALIFIPGANGTGDIFTQAAEFLKDKFTVITFDRRGYGKSELTAPLPEEAGNFKDSYRIKTDAADVNALAETLSPDQKVYIMGSSSGSIVAMETLQDYPDIVEKISFHEPPLNSFLPDAAKHQAKNQHIINLALDGKVPEAMKEFGEFMRTGELDRQMMGQPAPGATEEEKQMRQKNSMYWFRYEISQYTSRQIDVEGLKQYRDKMSLLIGTDSRGSYPQDRAKDLAKIWGAPIYDIPGAHLGYAQKPEGFGTTLAAVLQGGWL